MVDFVKSEIIAFVLTLTFTVTCLHTRCLHNDSNISMESVNINVPLGVKSSMWHSFLSNNKR